MGEEIGRIYVAHMSARRTRPRWRRWWAICRATYRDRITKLDWMDAPTKAEALKKLEKITTHIGYPRQMA